MTKANILKDTQELIRLEDKIKLLTKDSLQIMSCVRTEAKEQFLSNVDYSIRRYKQIIHFYAKTDNIKDILEIDFSTLNTMMEMERFQNATNAGTRLRAALLMYHKPNIFQRFLKWVSFTRREQ